MSAVLARFTRGEDRIKIVPDTLGYAYIVQTSGDLREPPLIESFRLHLKGRRTQTMSRESSDEIRDGRVYNGFDYALQVWVLDGIIQDVGLGRDLVGQSIYTVEGAQER